MLVCVQFWFSKMDCTATKKYIEHRIQVIIFVLIFQLYKTTIFIESFIMKSDSREQIRRL